MEMGLGGTVSSPQDPKLQKRVLLARLEKIDFRVHEGLKLWHFT